MLKSRKEIILNSLGIVMILWFVLSFIEVISKNTTPDPQYWGGNVFVLIVNFGRHLHG